MQRRCLQASRNGKCESQSSHDRSSDFAFALARASGSAHQRIVAWAPKNGTSLRSKRSPFLDE